MGKKGFEYEIRGYRYAPESFHAFKGLPGQKMEQIPLSDEQRRKMGYLCMTKGGKAGVAYVKHIERERERKCRLYMTYGFLVKENPHRYVYCAELRCRESDPLAVLGEISIAGTMLKVDELANALQVCLDSGAKKVLLPITSAADLGLVPADLIGCFNLVFYQSAEDAVYKALGVE